MLISVNLKYVQEYYPSKRHRIPRKRMLAEDISICIHEPTSENFPVALIENRKEWWYDQPEPEYKMVSTEIRFYDNRLWTPVRMSEFLSQGVGWAPPSHLTHVLNYPQWPYYGTPDVPFGEKSIIISTDLQKRIAELKDYASNYMVFDGKIWRSTHEPLYVVITFGLGNNHGGTAMFIDHHINSNIRLDNYFSALEYNKAVEYGKTVARNRGDSNSIDSIGDCGYIEVLMPEVIRFNRTIYRKEG